MPEGVVLLDGRAVPAHEAGFPLADYGVQSGVGVFESLAVREGRPLEVAEHVARLGSSAKRLAVPLPPADELGADIATVAAAVEGGFGWLKVIATRAGHRAVFGGRLDPSEEGRAVTAIVLPWRRAHDDFLAGVKTLNYAPFVLGLEEARRRGADEGLWCNERGHLAEGCSSNVFVVKGRAAYTPAISDGILPGVTRNTACAALRSIGLHVHEGKVRLERLRNADEAFLTSSLRAVRPLLAVDGRALGRGVPGPVTIEVARRVLEARKSAMPIAPAIAQGRARR
jgi:branched-subunit amino acid aminotransferase/4-amino-4-deoxychorismate lyase